MAKKASLRANNEGMVLRKGFGTNPSGDRYLYDVTEDLLSPEYNNFLNTGYVLLAGIEDGPPNLYPGENISEKRFKVSKRITEEIFTKI